MNILLVGSLPPSKDGIADHNLSLFKSILVASNKTCKIIPNVYDKKRYRNILFYDNIIDFNQAKHTPFDIVHIQFGNSFTNSFVFPIFNYYIKKQIPVVSTLHDLNNSSIAKIVRALYSDPGTLRFDFVKPSMQQILKKSSKVVVYSNFLKSHLVSKYGFENKIEVIYHGAELINMSKILERKKLMLPSKELVILTYGFITPRKGYEEVLKSLIELKQKKIRFKYIITGNFNYFHYKVILKKLVKDLNLDNQVEFTGYLPQEKIRSLMTAADIIVQPRKYSTEGASGSLVSAMSAGTPVITVPIGGMGEYIINKETGVLVKHKAKEYSNALIELYKNKTLQKKIIRMSKKWIKTNLAWEIIAEKNLQLYKKILNENY